MSIASEIQRLQGVRTDIFNAITDKGVSVPSGAKLADCPELISLINTSFTFPTKDYCVNGGLSIWQKGTQFEVDDSNIITADMWRVNSYGGANGPITNLLVSKDSDSPNAASNFCLKLKPKLSVPVLTGDVDGHVRSAIDGINFKEIFGKRLVCSFYVKTNVTGVFCLAVVNSTNTKTYVAEYTVERPDVWEYKTVIVPFENLDTADWFFGNDTAVKFRFEIFTSGDMVAPNKNTWLSGNYAGTINQVNLASDSSNYFKLAQVKFEINDVESATPYDSKDYSVDLIACQRYYQRHAVCIDFNAASSGEYMTLDVPLFAPIIKTPRVSVINDLDVRQPLGGFAMNYPGQDASATKEINLSPVTFICSDVSTNADDVVHAVRARFISTGSGRNALINLLVELDSSI